MSHPAVGSPLVVRRAGAQDLHSSGRSAAGAAPQRQERLQREDVWLYNVMRSTSLAFGPRVWFFVHDVTCALTLCVTLAPCAAARTRAAAVLVSTRRGLAGVHMLWTAMVALLGLVAVARTPAASRLQEPGVGDRVLRIGAAGAAAWAEESRKLQQQKAAQSLPVLSIGLQVRGFAGVWCECPP